MSSYRNVTAAEYRSMCETSADLLAKAERYRRKGANRLADEIWSILRPLNRQIRAIGHLPPLPSPTTTKEPTHDDR